jgi:hypothetical protein
MEKLAIMDYIQKIPAKDLKKMAGPETEDDVKEKLDQLNKLEQEIEKEKSEISKAMDKKADNKGKQETKAKSIKQSAKKK